MLFRYEQSFAGLRRKNGQISDLDVENFPVSSDYDEVLRQFGENPLLLEQKRFEVSHQIRARKIIQLSRADSQSE